MMLAHELAHLILSHNKEGAMHRGMALMVAIQTAPAVWALLPWKSAVLTTIVLHELSDLLFQLPNSREREFESDRFGLELAAKACFDIHEAPLFLRSVVQDKGNAVEAISEYFSTHPSGRHRVERFKQLCAEAVRKRTESGCKVLPERNCTNTYGEQSMEKLMPLQVATSGGVQMVVDIFCSYLFWYFCYYITLHVFAYMYHVFKHLLKYLVKSLLLANRHQYHEWP